MSGRWRVDRVLDGLSRLCLALAGVAMVVLTAIFGWLVYGRYVLNATPTWVEQVALLLVMVITFLGAAAGIHQRTHLTVSLLQDLAGPTVRRILRMTSCAMLAAFGGAMGWYGARLVIFKWGSDIPLLGLPEGLRAIPLALAGALILLFSLGHLLRLARGIEPGTAE